MIRELWFNNVAQTMTYFRNRYFFLLDLCALALLPTVALFLRDDSLPSPSSISCSCRNVNDAMLVMPGRTFKMARCAGE